MNKRFIQYIIFFKSSSSKTSWQTAVFDTITKTSTFASDLFFKPEELKHW